MTLYNSAITLGTAAQVVVPGGTSSVKVYLHKQMTRNFPVPVPSLITCGESTPLTRIQRANGLRERPKNTAEEWT